MVLFYLFIQYYAVLKEIKYLYYIHMYLNIMDNYLILQEAEYARTDVIP